MEAIIPKKGCKSSWGIHGSAFLGALESMRVNNKYLKKEYFKSEPSLGNAWWPGRLTQTGLDAFPEPESHG